MPINAIITERQLRLVNEAMTSSFDYDELNNIKTFSGRLKYCKQTIGNPIGRGSSRIVFQMTDYQVLKLAINQKGVAQNEYEGRDDWYKAQYSIFPKVYAHAEDYSWLLSEYVISAKSNDFKQCIGMTFEEWCSIVFAIGSMLRPSRYSQSSRSTVGKVIDFIRNNKFANEFYDYVNSYDLPTADFTRIANYGLSQRNGKPCIVILDSGLNYEIYDKYYKRY
jgi:hypothetical protein